MRVFRFCKAVHSDTVLSGAGGLAVDGRWHTRGLRVVYCASSESLAVLEVRVHLGRVRPAAPFTMHELDVPDSTVESVPPGELPADWARVPIAPGSQHVGSTWLASRRSLALRVPSVHAMRDDTVLLNPEHPAITDVRIVERRAYRFDGRLF